MNLSKYENKGFTGLTNLGNTCFLNSCLQVLNHTYELHFLLDSDKCKKYIKNTNDSVILNEWNNLRNLMWSDNGVISPNKFVYNVQQIARRKNKEIFTGWAQNDMSEFLLFMVDCLHNSISRKITMKISGSPKNNVDKTAITCYEMLRNVYSTEYSEIMEMFYGIYVTNISSLNAKKTHSIKPEHFFILDLQLFENSTFCKNIYECFDLFVKPEILNGDNEWYNEKTKKKEEVQKKILFWNLPELLVITLKRFSPDGEHKINNIIDFPLLNLDLSKYVHGYNPSSYVYDLYGVCNHMGSASGGHYTSFVKNSGGKWIHYNDTTVEIIEHPNIVVSPMAYCLFYRKKKIL